MRSLRLLALLFLTTTTYAAVPLPPQSDEWGALTAGEFRIYSNASPRVTRQIATNLLRMREALGKVTTLDVQAMPPTYVLIFRSRHAFAPYRDALFGNCGQFAFPQPDAAASIQPVPPQEFPGK